MKDVKISARQPKSADLELIEHPERWPGYPILPLKSRDLGDDGWPQMGIVGYFPGEGIRLVVYLAIMGDFSTLAQLEDEFVGIVYDSAEALLRDWEID